MAGMPFCGDIGEFGYLSVGSRQSAMKVRHLGLQEWFEEAVEGEAPRMWYSRWLGG